MLRGRGRGNNFAATARVDLCTTKEVNGLSCRLAYIIFRQRKYTFWCYYLLPAGDSERNLMETKSGGIFEDSLLCSVIGRVIDRLAFQGQDGDRNRVSPSPLHGLDEGQLYAALVVLVVALDASPPLIL